MSKKQLTKAQREVLEIVAERPAGKFNDLLKKVAQNPDASAGFMRKRKELALKNKNQQP